MYYRRRFGYSRPRNVSQNYVKDPTIPQRMNAVLKQPTITAKHQSVVESMKSTWKKYNQLTENQYNFFKSIEDSYSVAALASRAAAGKKAQKWASSFAKDPEKVLRFKLAVQYYSTKSYFSDVVLQAKKDSSFVPSERLYEKMCLNPYMSKVWDNYNAPAKFEVGEMVSLLSSYAKRGYEIDTLNSFVSGHLNRLRNDSICLVIEVDSRAPISARKKGTKIYKVVPVAWKDVVGAFPREKKPCYVMENHMRKMK